MGSAAASSALTELRDSLQSIVETIARDNDAPGTPAVELERPRDEKFGDFATNVALLLAPLLPEHNPRQVAQLIVEQAADLAGVSAIDIAGPGFINITMRDEWYLDTLAQLLDAGDAFGADTVAQRRDVLLEFVSANPTGPLVAASLRHAAYGDSLARILRHVGHSVTTEFYVNDAGRQVELFGESLIARAKGEEVPEGGYEGDYVKQLATKLGVTEGTVTTEAGAAGVDAMVQSIQQVLADFGVDFSRFFREQELHESGAVDRGIVAVQESGHTFTEDDALFLRSTTYGDDKDRALVRGNGTPTYFAADIAYLQNKFSRVDDEVGRLIYVLGADHHGYVARLKAAAQALGHPPDDCEVQIIQMVSLIEHGQQKKMSKRRGDFVEGQELIDLIGVDSARFFMLYRSHEQTLDLDLDLAREQSDKNPVFYVQYAHARLCSLQRKAAELGREMMPASEQSVADWLATEDLHESEKRLIKRLTEFPMLVADAAAKRQPHRVLFYAYDVASDVSSFYRDCRATGDGISATLTQRRLAVAQGARNVLHLALSLAGVSAPESMERRTELP